MSDVISAVLGEKQRILMEALADYNKNINAARVLDPEGSYVNFYIHITRPHPADGYAGWTAEAPVRSIVSKRVAVSQKEILDWLLEIEGKPVEVKIDYEDRSGNVTKDRLIRVSQVQKQRDWGVSRYRPTMIVGWDLEKQDTRNFVLTRIQRVESVD